MHPPVGDFSLEDKKSRHEMEIQGLSLQWSPALSAVVTVGWLIGKAVPLGQKEMVRKPKNRIKPRYRPCEKVSGTESGTRRDLNLRPLSSMVLIVTVWETFPVTLV